MYIHMNIYIYIFIYILKLLSEKPHPGPSRTSTAFAAVSTQKPARRVPARDLGECVGSLCECGECWGK